LKPHLIFPRRNKAVAVGAVSYYIDHFVKGRILKFTYGTPRRAPYDPSDPEHIRREHNIQVDVLGGKSVRGAFRTMLSKVRHQTTTTLLPALLTDRCGGYLGH
jgi:hypothetical protein